jgi:SAM-dependent methyltransferase
VQHWNCVSSYYDSQVVETIDERLWGRLIEHGVIPVEGKVLDIGCGTGALTERFAMKGGSTVGLDISPGMLALATERLGSRSNVELICQDWMSFNGEAEYDLVFSSFCPAVDGLASILKMDALSKGACCLVSLGRSSNDPLEFEIWEELGYPGMSLDGFDPIFPYYALKELGREPTISNITVYEESVISERNMMEHLMRYFSLFQDLTPDMLRTIGSNVARRASQGQLSVREERTVSVLSWKALNARTVS